MANRKNRGKKGNNQPKTKQNPPKKQSKRTGAPQSNMRPHVASAGDQYYATVVAPCSGNARIPDMSGTDSFLCTIDAEFTVPTNAQGCGGLYIPITNVQTGSATVSVESGASTDSIIAYNTSTVLPGMAALSANASASRVVSACVDAVYTGSSNNDSGYIIAASIAKNEPLAGAGPTSATQLANTRLNGSARIAKGIAVMYRPCDSECIKYFATNLVVPVGALIFHISGAATAVNMRVRVRINYECLASSDNTTFTAGIVASPVDPVAHAKAINGIKVAPAVMTADVASSTTAKMSKAFQTAVHYGSEIYSAIQAGRQVAGMLL